MSLKIKNFAGHFARVVSVSAAQRGNIKPVRRFEAVISSPKDDKQAMSDDFMRVGTDMKKAMERHGRHLQLTE